MRVGKAKLLILGIGNQVPYQAKGKPMKHPVCWALTALIMISSVTSSLAEEIRESQKPYHGKTALVGATLISPHLATPIENALVLINKGKIEALGPQSMPLGDDYQVIDLTGQYLLPGYIDAHVHFFQSGSPFTRPDILDFRTIQPYELDHAWVRDHLSETFTDYLRHGITGAVDMGGPSWNYAVRAQANNALFAPHIAVAGPLISPMDAPALDLGDPVFVKITSPEQAQAYVKQQLLLEPDLIKIFWMEHPDIDQQQQLSAYQAAIDLAHENDVRIAVHAFELANAKKALLAGADILVHGLVKESVDDEFVQLLLKTQAIYIPTLTALTLDRELYQNAVVFTEHEKQHGNSEILNSFDLVSQHEDKLEGQAMMMKKYLPYVDQAPEKQRGLSEREKSIVAMMQDYFGDQNRIIQQDNVVKLHRAGVTIALGTDAGNPAILHGTSLLREMTMMKQAGLSNRAILEATTLHGAKVMGREDSVGSIEVGKLADLVILNSNPLKDVKNFSDISAVVKQGHYLKSADIDAHLFRVRAELKQ
jgi:imidazolonepropionase-like amidohydrolase